MNSRVYNSNMSLDYDVSDNSAEDSSDDTSSYHGSCELSDSQEDVCDIGMFRRGSDNAVDDRYIFVPAVLQILRWNIFKSTLSLSLRSIVYTL